MSRTGRPPRPAFRQAPSFQFNAEHAFAAWNARNERRRSHGPSSEKHIRCDNCANRSGAGRSRPIHHKQAVWRSGQYAKNAIIQRTITEKFSVVAPAFSISPHVLAEFCRRHSIRRLSYFGSIVRDDFRPDSDIDVLVEFQPGKVVGWDIVTIEDDLSRLFDSRKVDLVRTSSLNPRLKDRILSSAQVQYEER